MPAVHPAFASVPLDLRNARDNVAALVRFLRRLFADNRTPNETIAANIKESEAEIRRLRDAAANAVGLVERELTRAAGGEQSARRRRAIDIADNILTSIPVLHAASAGLRDGVATAVRGR